MVQVMRSYSDSSSVSGLLRAAWLTPFCVGLMCAAASAATETPALTAEELLSEDGFGLCVPEENLDEIWIVVAKGGKGERVPHVCMRGDCDDLPDIAEWALTQGYPEDIDLERDEVRARYATFVASFCAPEDDNVPEVLLEAPPEAPPEALPPALARMIEPLFTPPRTPPFRHTPPRPPQRDTPRMDIPFQPLFPGTGGVASPISSTTLNGDPPNGPPTAVIPLPATGWLLLSVIGFGLWLGQRRRCQWTPFTPGM